MLGMGSRITGLLVQALPGATPWHPIISLNQGSENFVDASTFVDTFKSRYSSQINCNGVLAGIVAADIFILEETAVGNSFSWLKSLRHKLRLSGMLY
jgi:hypothetical protein